MPVIKECIICHKSFSVPPTREKSAKVCSNICKNKLQSQRDERITITCENCGKDFKRFKSQLVGKNNFCSRRCANESRLIHVYKCEVCGKIFHKSQSKGKKARFCSKPCAYKQLKIERNPPNTKCSNCGKLLHVNPYLLDVQNNFYCSNECRKAGMTFYLKQIPPIQRIYSLTEWRKLRLQIIERDNHTCQHCGLKPGKHSKLQVHHIKRRKEGGADEPENLITLCFSCHKIADGRLY